MSEGIMKMETKQDPAAIEPDDMLPDYSGLLKNGVRGKYSGQIRRKANLAVLAPDVAEAFPTDQEVNDALRSLIEGREKSAARR